MVRGFIVNLDTNGRLPLAEILEKVNKEDVELIVITANVSSLILLNWHLLHGNIGPC